jgi:hypothetical protein
MAVAVKSAAAQQACGQPLELELMVHFTSG